MMSLRIGYFYPDLLNLYGDNGNIEILKYRCFKRGISVSIQEITLNTQISQDVLDEINLLFMGGGPDSSQKKLYEDLSTNKASFVKSFIESGKPGLFVCGAYQLLGHYYKASDGTTLNGLGIFDLYTEHFGNKRPRCIGNTVAKLNSRLVSDESFVDYQGLGGTIVGFENHGGRTYLGKNIEPLAKVIKGHGNNSEDFSEGCLYKNAIGTYFHGPLLAKNPHIADFLIYKALNFDKAQIQTLPILDDSLIISAHTASKNLKQ